PWEPLVEESSALVTVGQELEEDSYDAARMSMEHMVARAGDFEKADPRIGRRKLTHVGDRCDLIALAVDEERRPLRHPREDAVHPVVEQAVLERRGEREERELPRVSQHAPGEVPGVAERHREA